jgi:hypothetical protein
VNTRQAAATAPTAKKPRQDTAPLSPVRRPPRPPLEADTAYDRDLSHLDHVHKRAKGKFNPKLEEEVQLYAHDVNGKHYSRTYNRGVWDAVNTMMHLYGLKKPPTALEKFRAMELPCSRIARMSVAEVVLPYFSNKAKKWGEKDCFIVNMTLPSF